ncbi:MAG: Tetratricopeptide 1 repeat-containing protein [Bacteroidota bacterium]|nr:Tetratricopeptide 1 repeat-containing protein [Bacteroidota bacterium]
MEYNDYLYQAYIESGNAKDVFKQIAKSLTEKYKVEADDSVIPVHFGDWKMLLKYSDGESVAAEAAVLATRYNKPQLANCTARIEINGQDDAEGDRYEDHQGVIAVVSAFKEVHIVDQSIGDFLNALDRSGAGRVAMVDPRAAFLQEVEGNSEIKRMVNSLRSYANDSAKWYNLALAYESEDLPDLALKCYEISWTQNPYDYDAYNNAALILWRKGDLNKAIELGKQALIANPKIAYCRANLGIHYAENGDKQEAIDCFKMAIEVGPNKTMGYTNLGYYLILFGRPDEALEYTDKAIAPGNFSNSYLNKGHVQLIRGEREAAIESYVKSRWAFKSEKDFWKDYESDFEVLPPNGITPEQYEEVRKDVKKRIKIRPADVLKNHDLEEDEVQA